MDFDKVMNRAFEMLEKSLESKGKDRMANARRLAEISKEQEKTKRLGFSSQERLQNLTNKGLINKQEITNTGLMNVAQMKEFGLSSRQESSENGINSRHRSKLEAERTKPIFKQDKSTSIDRDGNEVETSSWKNYNTPGGRINGADGGSFDSTDADFLSGPAPGAQQAARAPEQKTNSLQHTFGDMPKNTGYLQLEDGSNKRYGVNGDNIQEEAMPSRTHSFAPPAPVQTQAAGASPMLAPASAPTQRTMPQYQPSQPGYQHIAGRTMAGGGGQSPIDSGGQQIKPFGQGFIDSNLGHALHLDQAQGVSNAFNRTLSGAGDFWSGASRAIVDKGIKPVTKWAGQEYQDPYKRKLQ